MIYFFIGVLIIIEFALLKKFIVRHVGELIAEIDG